MTKQEKPRAKRGKLKITLEGMVSIIQHIIDFDGLEAAREEYKHMCVTYATFPGWTDTAVEIMKLLSKERKRQQKQEQANRRQQHTEEMEMARAAAPKYIQSISNDASIDKNTSNFTYDIDQLNGFVEAGAEIVHTKMGRTRK